MIPVEQRSDEPVMDGLGVDSEAWRIVQEWARHGTVPTAKLGGVLRRYAALLDPEHESAAIEYDDEIDTVTGVTEMLQRIREAGRPALIDWRYAHTLKIEIDWLRSRLQVQCDTDGETTR